MKKIVLTAVALVALAAVGAWAADLTIDMQVNAVAKDYAGNFLTFKGAIVSVDKDQFAPGADATSGASKLKSTEDFNAYRFDVKGKATMPGYLRSMLLYAVADDGTRTGDGLSVTKNADGSIMVRSVHRGTAYEFTTDTTGKLALPTTAVKMRKIGHTDNTISTDFSSTGKVADVDWKKVWDKSIADGKVVGSTTSKTGPIAQDVAVSEIFAWTGAYQFAFDGKILKVTAALDAQKK
jgi:hypothetical protein